jgi:nucleotide-binding universal stress UspA family protein
VSWAAKHARSDGKLHVIYSRPVGKGVDEEAVLATLHIQAGGALAGLDWDFEVLEGRPAQVLLAAGRRHDADEIVVGLSSDGRTLSSHDSVSRDLIRAADRPVVVVPAQPS